MNRAMVIGGSGFSGRHLIRELLGKGLEVIAIENKTPVPHRSDVKVITGGIGALNRHLIEDLKPEVIFHFARPRFPGLRKAGRILAARYAAFQNAKLVRELERARHSCSLVFASGSLMYGSSPSALDEDSPLRPESFARQYYHGEAPILEALKARNIPVSVIRFPWLLGNGSWFEWYYLRPMMNALAVPLFGDGENLMDIIDIEDAARLAVRYADEIEGPGIYNLTTAGPVIQAEFASAVSGLSGLPVRNYRKVFTGRLEKESLQAFSSNIVLRTKYPDLVKDRHYHPLKDTLQRIFREAGFRSV